MNNFKSHFRYSKNQRNGILFLIGLIFIIQLIYFFLDFTTKESTNTNTPEIEEFQKQIDSLKKVKEESSKSKLYLFNPNYLTDFKAYQLGMNVNQIDRLLSFRETGSFINSPEQFQEITQISDSLLKIISPRFKFPEWTKEKKNIIENTSIKSSSNPIKDLNLATQKNLEEINGVGEKLAKRILAYRKLLNGYSYNDQLYEVYYLDSTTANKVLARFSVLKKPDIQPININNASFKEILKLPYIDYNLTKKIVNYREINGQILSLEILKEIDSFPLDKFNRISLYLMVK